jgi:hypothetical protein
MYGENDTSYIHKLVTRGVLLPLPQFDDGDDIDGGGGATGGDSGSIFLPQIFADMSLFCVFFVSRLPFAIFLMGSYLYMYF